MKICQLLRNRVLFFNCDIQTVFNNPKHMYNPGQTIQCAQLMNEAAGILNIPVVYTEQNVKAFGSTIPEVKATISPLSHYYEKHTFSMYNEDGKRVLQQYPEKNQVVIYGWEAHVCVQQTCLDLVRNGYQVHILTDGTSSNKPLYRSTCYQRLAQQGVVIDNSQSVLYELLQSYKDEKFKPILNLFKKYKFEEVFTTL
ncbi:unnamed protein product [Paramecium sonneborni]|uniref:Isochorismatase-like domain-containing protein n=1 Tax=Paramecium sonneborni TaxID=65129 RepID=A0A8S1MUC2_9CILI|nr:unnamed protein product [Paramecium sonneborni]